MKLLKIDELRGRINKGANKQISKAEKIEFDEKMLMSQFLSEIERLQSTDKINRRDLAKYIGTSPSYLTQVFRGDKPLNFKTLAKIQDALTIRFNVTAIHKNGVVKFKWGNYSEKSYKFIVENNDFKGNNLAIVTASPISDPVTISGTFEGNHKYCQNDLNG